jgi:hypothetical protein
MKPVELDAAAEQLESLRAAGGASLTAGEIAGIRSLACAAAENWRHIWTLAALNSGGYTPDGAPSSVPAQSGALHG